MLGVLPTPLVIIVHLYTVCERGEICAGEERGLLLASEIAEQTQLENKLPAGSSPNNNFTAQI